jgi:hypothetical protein
MTDSSARQLTAQLSAQVFGCLTPDQLDTHHLAFRLLRDTPGRWRSIAELDARMARGVNLTDFPGDWLDGLVGLCQLPGSQYHIAVDITTRVPAEIKNEGPDDDLKEMEDITTTLVCTARSDPDRAFKRPMRGSISGVLDRLDRAAEATGTKAPQVTVLLRFDVVEVSDVAALVTAVQTTQASSSGCVGIKSTFVSRTNEARRAMQAASDRGLVYVVPAYGGAGKSKRGALAAAQRRAALKAAEGRGDDNDDADIAVAGGADVVVDAGETGAPDFSAWMRASPIVFRCSRTVDSVVLDEEGLPAVVKLGDSAATVTLARRTPAQAGARYGGVLRVSLYVDEPKPVELSKTQFFLRDTTPETFTVTAAAATKGAIRIRVVDVGPPTAARPIEGPAFVEGVRTVVCGQPFQIPTDEKRPVVFFHKGTPADNLYLQYGIHGWLRACDREDPARRVTHLLSPAPSLTAALFKGSVTAADLDATQRRLIENVPLQLQQMDEAARAGGVWMTSSSSSSDEEGENKAGGPAAQQQRRHAPHGADEQAAYARYMSNRHMLALGVDLRAPFVPPPDPSTTKLQPIGQAAAAAAAASFAGTRRPKRLR